MAERDRLAAETADGTEEQPDHSAAPAEEPCE